MQASHQLRPERRMNGAAQTLFPGLSLEACRTDLDRDCVHAGLQLSPEVVAGIEHFAASAACTRPGYDETFSRHDVRNGLLPDGRPVVIADLHSPLKCPQVDALCSDPGLLAVVADHLGYRARRVEPRLYWSFVGNFPDDLRRSLFQTIDFHYDVPWFNAVYAYFYLTAVDERTGAHVIWRGSARDKPLRFILASAFQSEGRLVEYYGATRKLVLCGPAGFGFLEDPFAFHTAIPPSTSDRLMLQIRYS
jgi:hypothetical protein